MTRTEIIVSKEGEQLARYVFGPGEYVFGREPDCEVVLDVGLVSRRHAKLTINHNEWIIEDLDSSNGTFVNGKPVLHPVKVWPRQEIGIGSARVMLRQLKDEEAGPLLSPAAVELRRLLPPELLTPRKYDIGGVVGHGGMGAILDARDLATRRTVAMKVMLSDISREDVVRFIEEAQVTAQLEHPNIVPVHELSVDEQDHVFYTMKFVQGVTLKSVLGKIAEGDAETIAKFPLRRLMQMMLRVCDAIAFANSKGVIHRDLKPENIMTGDFGEVLVMDWGLAKVLGKEETGAGKPSPVLLSVERDSEGSYTLAGAVMGTPSFMAPEQAEGEAGRINASTDVYALGAIVYQILTLHEPVRGDSAEEVMEKVRRNDIASPMSFNSPGRRIPAALSAIVMKAMSLKQEDRYPTANELKADIDAWLSGFATRAEQAGLLTQVSLLIKRNRAVFATLFAAWLFIVALAAWFVVNLARERDLAERSAEAEAVQRREAQEETKKAEAAVAETRETLSQSSFLQALRLVDQDKAPDALVQLVRSISLKPPNGVALCHLTALLLNHNFELPVSRLRHHGPVLSAQFSPDGKWIATASQDHTARVWDAQTGKAVTEPLRHDGPVRSAQFSPDGKRLVTTSQDKTARIWDAQTGRLLAGPLRHDGPVRSAQFSPDGKRVVTASDDTTARLWDAQTGKQIGEPLRHHGWVRSAEFSPDGKKILTASFDSTARIWDAQTGQPLTEPLRHDAQIWSARFSPNGNSVVTASSDTTARIWDAQTGQPLTGPLKHDGAVLSAGFSPDGKRIVTASEDTTARVWDAQTGQPLIDPLKHDGTVLSAEFSPDGKRVVTSSQDHTGRVWDAETGEALTEPMKHENWVSSAEFSPDGRWIVTASKDDTARVWDALSGKMLTEPLKHGDEITWAQFSPGGKRVVTASEDKTARVWDAQTGEALTEPLKHGGAVLSAEFSPDGKRIVTASEDKTARVWDAETGKPLARPLKHDGAVLSAQFSPDGKWIVTASQDHTARIWDAQTGQPLAHPLKHDDVVLSARFSPDGKRIVTASEDKTARVWDAQNGKPLIGSLRQTGVVLSAQFSPDGKRVVLGLDDSTARVWDAETGRSLIDALRHDGPVRSAQFSPDGKRIVTASSDTTARVWDAQTGLPLSEPLQHDGPVRSAQFSPDGKWIVTASDDNTARVWDTESGEPLTEPLRHEGSVRSAQFSPDGKQVVTASSDETARVWDISPQVGHPPEWLPRLAEAVAGEHLNVRGEYEPLKEEPIQVFGELRAKLNRAPADDDWAILGRWFLADRSTRTISPFSKITVPEYIENRIREGTSTSLDEAEGLAAGDKGILSRIAKMREQLQNQPGR